MSAKSDRPSATVDDAAYRAFIALKHLDGMKNAEICIRETLNASISTALEAQELCAAKDAEIAHLRAQVPSYEEAVEHCYVRGFFVTPMTLDWSGICADLANGKIAPADLSAIARVMEGE